MRLALSRLAVVLTISALASSAAARPQEPVDEDAVKTLREHGLEKSQVMEHLSWICDVHGPRLTGSPNIRRAQEWAKAQLAEWGLEDARLEPWGPFGRGWQLDHFSVRVVGENPWPVHAYPKAWSPSLDGIQEAEVILLAGLGPDEVEALDLTGKIVMVEPAREVGEPFDGLAKRHDAEALLDLADGRRGTRPRRPAARAGRRRGGERAAADGQRRGRRGGRAAAYQRRTALMRMVAGKRPLAILDRYSKGDYGTIFVSAASIPSPPNTPRSERPRPWRPGDAAVIPQLTLAVEHYNRICRMLEKGVPVRMALELRTQYFDDDPMQYNVVADIPGTDPEIGDELVMLGAHFDSWHSGTGATDNGCGSAAMMEAARLLTELVRARGKGPRRTIRIALWSGEEQGLLGSRAYVAEQFAEPQGRRRPPTNVKPAHAKLSGYYNLDNGTGRIRGVYLQGNEAVAPIFRAWLRPFHDLDASTLTLDPTGGTDHLSFDRVGLPGFQFIQDPVAYSPRTHHSNMDGWDHAIQDDLKQAATIIASFVWHTAQRDEKLPRKPLPVARPEGERPAATGSR